MHSQLPSPLAGPRKGGFGAASAAAAPLPSPLPSPLAGLRKGGFGTGFPPALETTTTPSPKNALSSAAAEAAADAAAGGSGGGRSSVGGRSIFDDDGADGRVHDLTAFAPSATTSERGGSSERGDGGAGGGDGDSDAPAFLLELEQELRYSVGREQDAATYAAALPH